MTVEPALIDGVVGRDFFEVCRRLEVAAGEKPRIADSQTRRDEFVRFGQDPHFSYGEGNINRAERDSDGAIAVYIRFLGLLGPQGALPLGMTEEAFRFSNENDPALARFLDLFNNRFVQMFFRAWADSRPLTYRDRPRDEDRFSAFLGTAIGLGSPVYRDRDTVDDMAKVAFSGLLGAKAKSASRLGRALSGLFGVRVEIQEFIGMRLLFEPDQRSRIGLEYATLGRDILIGSGAYSVQDKIRIRLYTTEIAQFEELLPVGPRSRPLAEFVHFYLGLELAWDVELCLPSSEAKGIALGKSGRLGWTSWLSPNWALEKNEYRADARFDLAKRFAPRPTV